MRIIRVFPRKTRATPDDDLAYFGPPDLFADSMIEAGARAGFGRRQSA